MSVILSFLHGDRKRVPPALLATRSILNPVEAFHTSQPETFGTSVAQML